jgi:type II secretory pathway component PulC
MKITIKLEGQDRVKIKEAGEDDNLNNRLAIEEALAEHLEPTAIKLFNKYVSEIKQGKAKISE